VKSRTLTAVVIGVCFFAVSRSAQARELKNEIAPFQQALNQQLQDRKFAELEQIEAQLRTDKARFTGGDWKLHFFYEGLGGALFQQSGVPIDSDYMSLLALLEEWRTASPKSGVPSLLLSIAFTKWAWHARTGRWPDQVSDQRFATFKDRLNQGAFYLNESRRLLANNPQWFVQALVVARGLGWGKAQAQTLFNEAMAVEPLYQHTYSTMAIYLLPRWYGEQGEWEAFANESTAKVGGQRGSAIYHHIVVKASLSHKSDEVFAVNDLNWRKIQWSFADRERLYGEGREAVNAMCWLAGAAKDIEAARGFMARIGEDWEQSVWNTRQEFDGFQAWLKDPK
jgi:hypothetical protein